MNDPVNEYLAERHLEHVNEDRVNEELAAKYEAIAYATKPVAPSHPAHLATIAKLFGLDHADVVTCRVLEVGCNDGTNLIPMAVTLPNAKFIGIELATRPVEAASKAIKELGLSNVAVVQGDLGTLDPGLGQFDYMIAHGVYSWVPATVRDALFELAAKRLSPNGIAFVSYNTLPGCHVRRVAWDILHFHTDRIPDAKARIDAARALCSVLAEPSLASEGSNALLRGEFSRLVEMPDSALFHDDLAIPNDPVYFHQFVAHAARHGLRFVAEAALSTMSGAGLAPRLRQMLATLDPFTREQYLDFARFRRFRQSLLRRADAPGVYALSARHIDGMHVSATLALQRAASDSGTGAPTQPLGDVPEVMRALLQWIVEASPQARSVDEARDWLRRRRTQGSDGKSPSRSIEELLLEACISGTVQLHARPLDLTTVIDEQPIATPFARWQSQHTDYLTNLRHDLVRVEDPVARQALRLLDGSRNRSQLIDALSIGLPEMERSTTPSRIDFYLQNFAKLALLMKH